jgi:hypothetical protein
MVGASEILDFTPESELPVYYLGSFGDASELQAKSIAVEVVEPEAITSKHHILIVDGSYFVDQEFLKDQVLLGNPVIAVGETRVMKGLFEEQFDAGELRGMTPAGVEMRETAFAYIHSLDMSWSFYTSEEDLAQAAALAHSWARQIMAEQKHMPAVTTAKDTTSPYFSSVHQRDWTSGDTWNPYGRMNVRTIFSKLYNDGSSSYDWFDIRFKHQTLPGSAIWSSGWRNADLYTWVDADYVNSSYFLSDYAPTTTQGASSVGVSVGVTAGADGASVNASISWSYTITDVPVYDQSDFSQELAKWWHNIDESKGVGSNTYMAEPGACVRVPSGHTPYNYSYRMKEHYGAKYAKEECSGAWFWRTCSWNLSTEGWVEYW